MMQILNEWKVTVSWPDRTIDFWLAGNSLFNVLKAACEVRFKPDPESIKIELVKNTVQASTNLAFSNQAGQSLLSYGIN